MKGVLHFWGHQTETKLQSIRVGGSDRRIFPWKFSDEIPPMDRFAGEESRARSKAVRPIESNGTPMTRPDQRLMIRDVTGLLFRAAVICFHQENFTIFDRKNLNVNFVIQVNRATSRFLTNFHHVTSCHFLLFNISLFQCQRTHRWIFFHQSAKNWPKTRRLASNDKRTRATR